MSEKISFEKAMARLGEIAKKLDDGDTPLAESLALFEEGSGLIFACSKELDEAEQVVVKLKKNEDGSQLEVPFGERDE